MTGPGNTKEIEGYMHCALCVHELMAKHAAGEELTTSPGAYQRLGVGWTPVGLQVWCSRHEVNIVHIDFQGQRHPANTTRLEPALPQ